MKGYGITATRSGYSVNGAAQGPVIGPDGKPLLFLRFTEAREAAARLNAATVSPHVYYAADPYPQEMTP